MRFRRECLQQAAIGLDRGKRVARTADYHTSHQPMYQRQTLVLPWLAAFERIGDLMEHDEHGPMLLPSEPQAKRQVHSSPAVHVGNVLNDDRVVGAEPG